MSAPPPEHPANESPPPTSPPAEHVLDRDRRLLDRWRRGDSAAGLELLDHYRSLFVRQCRRHGVGETERVVDLWQELIVRLLERLPQLAGELRQSFAGVLCYEVREVVRRLRLWERRPDDLALARPEDPLSPSEHLALREAIEGCAERLPPRERQVFTLRYEQGLAPKEVAESLEMKANAVSQALFRISQRMRECLRGSGY